MEIAVAVIISAVVILLVRDFVWWLTSRNRKKALRYAVTLRNNEGAFVGLCIEKHRDRWVFEDVKILPTNPGAAVMDAAPGRLSVPYRNILYYQEIQETANVVE